MASPTRWVWVNSRSWGWTGRPGVLQSMGSQRVRHDWATEVLSTVLCLVAQLCPTLWDPKDCIPPGILSMGILQAGILEWVAMPFSRESSQARDQTQVSRITGGFFTIWATREAPLNTVFHQLQMETLHFNIFEIRIHFNKQQSM